MRAPTVISPGWKKEISPFCAAPEASKGEAYQYFTGSGRIWPEESLATALKVSLPPREAVACAGVTSTVAMLDFVSAGCSGSRGFCAVAGNERAQENAASEITYTQREKPTLICIGTPEKTR